MKAIVLPLFIVAALASYGDALFEKSLFEGGHHGIKHYFKNFLLPIHEKSFLHSIHLDCQRESSCELEYLQNPFEYMDYEPLGNYMLCMSKRYGFMGRHGHLKLKHLRHKLRMICGKEDPEFYIHACAVPSLNPIHTASNLWKCLDHHGFHFLRKLF
ncbi:uncharacterized protein LOC114332640 [Diabrotica virgifera virgifera]|uniref:Uncharacterized protein LOC114332640 n=1 Tax=Diabrotica virgifera virgifera TaxID=50390 RepID=A0A6P7FZJ4_DIAVI|nr:uncharacterized protein LOC114332640 [Diabrotica virgifera virgifera]